MGKKLPVWAQVLLALATVFGTVFAAWSDQEVKTRGLTEIADGLQEVQEGIKGRQARERGFWEGQLLIFCAVGTKTYDEEMCAQAKAHLGAMGTAK